MAIGGVLALLGCLHNPYQKNYSGEVAAPVDVKSVQVVQTENLHGDMRLWLRRGYRPLGVSTFNAVVGTTDRDQVRQHAARVGARAVLVFSQYSHTEAGAIPMVVPRTSTTTSSGSAWATGPGGAAYVTGNASSTTRSSETVYIPYSQSRADYMALFLTDTSPPLAGLFVVEIDDVGRQQLGRNGGVRVFEVQDDSPAYEADILPGDFVITVAGTRVRSVGDFESLLDRHYGRTVTFELVRNGAAFKRELQVSELQPLAQ